MAATSQQSLGCSVLIWIVVIGFIALMLVTLVPSVMQGIAVAVHCPGATEVLSDTQVSGSQGIRGGGTMRTSTTSLTCVFADGTVREIGNDPMFFTGFGGALVVSVVVGTGIAVLRWLFTRGKRG